MDWNQIVLNDVWAFNSCMKKYNVDAQIPFETQLDANRIKVFPESFLLYQIRVGDKVKFSKVTGLHKEIRSEIALHRYNAGLDITNFSVRFGYNPFFTLEVDSPNGWVLQKPNRQIPDYMSLIGVEYGFMGRRDLYFNLNEHHQTLIAAVSGHGKTVLLNTIIDGLIRTPPSKLTFHVIDFKNDMKIDGVRIRDYVTTEDEAFNLIQFLGEEKETRKFRKNEMKRLLVIDEGAEFPKELDKELASIMKLGRSIGLNTIMATQHPTAEQIGKMVARSFTHRIVGRVENTISAKWATGVEDSGADKLLKPGSFLFCTGSNVRRFQVFDDG